MLKAETVEKLSAIPFIAHAMQRANIEKDGRAEWLESALTLRRLPEGSFMYALAAAIITNNPDAEEKMLAVINGLSEEPNILADALSITHPNSGETALQPLVELGNIGVIQKIIDVLSTDPKQLKKLFKTAVENRHIPITGPAAEKIATSLLKGFTKKPDGPEQLKDFLTTPYPEHGTTLYAIMFGEEGYPGMLAKTIQTLKKHPDILGQIVTHPTEEHPTIISALSVREHIQEIIMMKDVLSKTPTYMAQLIHGVQGEELWDNLPMLEERNLGIEFLFLEMQAIALEGTANSQISAHLPLNDYVRQAHKKMFGQEGYKGTYEEKIASIKNALTENIKPAKHVPRPRLMPATKKDGEEHHTYKDVYNYVTFAKVVAMVNTLVKNLDPHHLRPYVTSDGATQQITFKISPLFAAAMQDNAGNWHTIGKTLDEYRAVDATNVKDTLYEFSTYVLLPSIISRLTPELMGQLEHKDVNAIVNASMLVMAEFLFQETSLNNIFGLSCVWHERRDGLLDNIRDFAPDNSEWATLLEGKKEVQVADDIAKGWKIVNLTTAEELREEGKNLSHCVGGYSSRCLAGETHILSIRNNHGEPVSTMEVVMGTSGDIKIKKTGKTLRIAQNYGMNNGTPPGKSQAVETWFRNEVEKYNPKKPKQGGIAINMGKAGLLETIGADPVISPVQNALGFDFLNMAEIRGDEPVRKPRISGGRRNKHSEPEEEKGEPRTPGQLFLEKWQRAYDVFTNSPLRSGRAYFVPKAHRGNDVRTFLKETGLEEKLWRIFQKQQPEIALRATLQKEKALGFMPDGRPLS